MVSVPFLVTHKTVQSLVFISACNAYAMANMTTDPDLHSFLAKRQTLGQFICGNCAGREQSCHKSRSQKSGVRIQNEKAEAHSLFYSGF